jgi:cullin 1
VAQMSILNMFNDATTYTYEQIYTHLKMKPELANSALQAIVKTEILILTHGDSIESPNATLAINSEFKK